MTSDISRGSLSESPARLDERTEQAIMTVVGTEWGDKRMAPAIEALRTRIRDLVEEARTEGANAMWTEIDTRGLPCD